MRFSVRMPFLDCSHVRNILRSSASRFALNHLGEVMSTGKFGVSAEYSMESGWSDEVLPIGLTTKP